MGSVPVELSLLGRPEVRRHGEPVRVPDQLLPLFVALALSAGATPKAELARDVLYLSPRSIDARLSRLGRAVGLDRGVHRVASPRSGLIELDRSIVRTDADEFLKLVHDTRRAADLGHRDRALRLALRADDLWRGDPATALPVPCRSEQVTRSIRELRNQRADLCSYGTSLLAELRPATGTVRVLRWAREDPDRDELWFAAVAGAFDLIGTSRALSILDEWRATVPGAGDHAAARWAGILIRSGRAIGPVAIGAVGQVDPPTFVRHRLAPDLERLAAGATSERGLLGVIDGPAGSGKTFALARVEERAAARASAIVRLDASALDTTTIVAAGLGPVWQRELRNHTPTEALVDSASKLHDLFEAPHGFADAADPERTVADLVCITATLLRSSTRRRPCLVIVDDVDCANRELVEWIVQLHRERVLGLTIVVSARRLPRTLAECNAHDDATLRLRLEPLQPVEAARLLRNDLDLDFDLEAITERMHRLGTTPGALIADDSGGPQPSSRVGDHERSLRHVARERRRSVAVGAVCAPDLSVDLDVAEALQPGARRALFQEADRSPALVADTAGIRFVDDEWRAVAYEILDPLHRRTLHERAAEVVDGLLTDEQDQAVLEARATQLAHHARLANLVPMARARALRSLSRAASEVATDDPARAAAIYTGAIDIGANLADRGDLLLRRAKLYWRAGEWRRAEADADEALRLAEEIGNRNTATEAMLLRAHLTWDPASTHELAAKLRSVLADIPADERIMRVRVRACLIGGLFQDGATPVEGAAIARSAIRELDTLEVQPDPTAEAEILWWARKGLLDIETPTRMAQLSRRMLRAATSQPSQLLGDARLAVLVDELVLGRIDRARATTAEYLHHREIGGQRSMYVSATLEAMWALYDADFDGAAEATDQAERLGCDFGGTTVRQVVDGQRIWRLRETGEIRTHPEILALVESQMPADGPIPIWAAAAAWLSADVGDAEAATGRIEEAVRRFDDLALLPPGPHRLPCLAFMADALWSVWRRRGGDVDRLARLVHAHLAQHPARGVLLGWPVAYLGSKHLFLAMAAAASGDGPTASEHLSRALRADAASTAPGIRARLVLAHTLAAENPPRAARLAARCAQVASAKGMRATYADASELAESIVGSLRESQPEI